MLLLGQYQHAIDDKGRLTIPSKLRDQFKSTKLYVSKGLDNCLEVRDEEHFITWAGKLNRLNAASKEARALSRQIMALSDETPLDSAGRIKLSNQHLQLLNIQKDIVIIGNVDRLELWNPTAWEEYQNSHCALDEFASSLDGVI